MDIRERIAQSYNEYAGSTPQERKRNRMVETANGSILPRLCTVWFYTAVVSTFAMVIVDIVNYFRHIQNRGIIALLANAGKTGLLTMVCFAVVLIPLCICNLIKVRKSEKTLNYKPYSVYLAVCLGVIVFFGMLFLFNIN